MEYIRKSTRLINPKVDHWKDRYEVDLVVKVGAETVPVEVKYKEDVKRGMVITKGCYQERKIKGYLLDLIPATVFLNSLNDLGTVSPGRSASADVNNSGDDRYPLIYFYPLLS